MGIARVDVWLADRYRLIAQPVNDVGIPPTDIMCIDVGSVFRRCTGWTESHARKSDDEISLRVLRHIEFLVSLIKPQQQLFIAVDGVPPMAFLQSERRKRCDNTSKKKKFLRDNRCHPTDTVFNINKITPGTDFMDQFDKHLAFFIRSKMAEDSDWKAPIVIYSGPHVHGDCKFKIMNYFRSNLRFGQVAPSNLTHCIYSVAPDMPLLGIMTHEPHLYILRETDSLIVGRPPSEPVVKHTQADYSTYHLGLLREYWQRDILQGPFRDLSIESTLEDFVFMCTLLGNDTLPRIPTLHTQEGGVECLLDAYKQVVLEYGYLLEPLGNRELNHSAVVVLFQILGSHQAELGRLMNRLRLKELQTDGHVLIHEESVAILRESGANHDPLELWKDRYYQVKMGYDFGCKDARNEVMHSYIEGLIWQAAYYVKGVYCWNYRYSENYGPCMSDMVDLSSIDVDFSRVSPLSKNEYMMSVFMAAEKDLVPEVLQCLMDNKYAVTKPVYDECKRHTRDLEGAWSEDDFHSQLKPFPARQFQKVYRRVPWKKIYPELCERDQEGKILVFKYRHGSRETEYCESTLPHSFFDVDTPHSMVFLMEGPKLQYPENYTGFPPHIPRGRRIGRDAPEGFPSFEKCPLLTEKLKLLNRTVYVCWPYLRKARVKAIADPFGQQRVEGTKYRSKEEQNEVTQRVISSFYYHRGINVREVDILLTVEIAGMDNLEIDEPIQAVLVKTKNGNLRCVLDYLAFEEKQSQMRMEDDCSDDLQNDSSETTPPSSLAASSSSGESDGDQVDITEMARVATPRGCSDRESQCSGSGGVHRTPGLNSAFMNGHHNVEDGYAGGPAYGESYPEDQTRTNESMGEKLAAWMHDSYLGTKNDGKNSGGSTEEGFDNIEDLDEDEFLRGSQSFDCRLLDEEHRADDFDGNPEGEDDLWAYGNKGGPQSKNVGIQHQPAPEDLPEPMSFDRNEAQLEDHRHKSKRDRRRVADLKENVDAGGDDVMYGTLWGVVHLSCVPSDTSTNEGKPILTSSTNTPTMEEGRKESAGGDSQMPTAVGERDAWAEGGRNGVDAGLEGDGVIKPTEIDVVEVKLTPSASGEEIYLHIHHDSSARVECSKDIRRPDGFGDVVSNSGGAASADDGEGSTQGFTGVSEDMLRASEVANELGVGEATLEKITSECFVEAGGEVLNLGLRLNKSPAMAGSSWMLSENLQLALEEYQTHHSWLFLAVDSNPHAPVVSLETIFPKSHPRLRLKMLKAAFKWIEILDTSGFRSELVVRDGASSKGPSGIHSGNKLTAQLTPTATDRSSSKAMIASCPPPQATIGDSVLCRDAIRDGNDATERTLPPTWQGVVEGIIDDGYLVRPDGGHGSAVPVSAQNVSLLAQAREHPPPLQASMAAQSVGSKTNGGKAPMRTKRLKAGVASDESCHSGFGGDDQDSGSQEVTSRRRSSAEKNLDDGKPGLPSPSIVEKSSGVISAAGQPILVVPAGATSSVGMAGRVLKEGQPPGMSSESALHSPLSRKALSGERKRRAFQHGEEVESKRIEIRQPAEPWNVNGEGDAILDNPHREGRQFEVASPPVSWNADKMGDNFAKQASPDPEFNVGEGKEHWRLRLGDEDKASVGSGGGEQQVNRFATQGPSK
ncbi:hypothetical protein BSKO_10450 [Bryopsis sp. KO-2023]|nr:hypothetical protein BSKO_10450 [Bryopsis sp. KO-2023]